MKETTIRPFLPMLERFEGFFREELSSRLSKETLESVMKKAIDDFRHVSAIIPDVPATSPWVKNIIGIAYEIGLWKELSFRGWSLTELSIVTQKALGKLTLSSVPPGKIPEIRDMLCSPDYVRSIASASRVSSEDDWLFDCVMPDENSTEMSLNILQYIQSNIYHPDKIKAKAISQHFGISPNYLGRYFKKQTNETMRQYILNYKMKMVESKLLHTDMRINEIVEEFGFTDESHLNRLFRKYKGISPTEFKKKNQQI